MRGATLRGVIREVLFLLSTLDADADIHDTRKVFLLHVVPNTDLAGLSLMELPSAGRDVILVNADATLHAVERVNQLAFHCVVPCEKGRGEVILNDNPNTFVWVLVVAAQPDAELVSAVLLQGVRVEAHCVVASPSFWWYVAVMVGHGAGVATRKRQDKKSCRENQAVGDVFQGCHSFGFPESVLACCTGCAGWACLLACGAFGCFFLLSGLWRSLLLRLSLFSCFSLCFPSLFRSRSLPRRSLLPLSPFSLATVVSPPPLFLRAALMFRLSLSLRFLFFLRLSNRVRLSCSTRSEGLTDIAVPVSNFSGFSPLRFMLMTSKARAAVKVTKLAATCLSVE